MRLITTKRFVRGDLLVIFIWVHAAMTASTSGQSHCNQTAVEEYKRPLCMPSTFGISPGNWLRVGKGAFKNAFVDLAEIREGAHPYTDIPLPDSNDSCRAQTGCTEAPLHAFNVWDFPREVVEKEGRSETRSSIWLRSGNGHPNPDSPILTRFKRQLQSTN
jgi:hypothetical protein